MHTWVEHTAELELRVEAADEAAVFAEALAALGELLDDDRAGGEHVERAVALDAADRPALLAAWIDELAYLAETEDLIPLEARAVEVEDGVRLRATVVGRPGRPRHVVKGATYHRLRFAPEGDGYVATVVLDV